MKPIRYLSEDKTLLVRDGIILVFFCKRPFHEISKEVLAVFDEWLKVIPGDVLNWALVGESAEEAKKINSKKLEQCRSLLDPKKSAKRELTAFTVHGDEEFNPSYQFTVEGARDIENDDTVDTESNLIEMRFPTEFFQQQGSDTFVNMALKVAQQLTYDTGYASLALNWSVESELYEASKIIIPLALRHPGFDIHQNDTTRYDLGRRSRGSRWLTFIADDLINELGGHDILVKQLDPKIQVLKAGKGLALRAGTDPMPGDNNRDDKLPLLRSVAGAIEKITFFGDPDMERHLFQGDTERFEQWERRFFI